MTIQWRVLELDRKLSDGGVFAVHWQVIAARGEIGDSLMARTYGAISVTPDPESPDFIAYDDLTQDDCLEWVWDQIDKEATELRVTTELEALENPVSGSGTPWSS